MLASVSYAASAHRTKFAPAFCRVHDALLKPFPAKKRARLDSRCWRRRPSFCGRVSNTVRAAESCSGIILPPNTSVLAAQRASRDSAQKPASSKIIQAQPSVGTRGASQDKYCQQRRRRKVIWPPKQQPPTPCRATPTSLHREEDETRPARPSTTSSRRSTSYAPHRRTRLPTTMPPPAAGLAAGALGDRHVVCFLGLPARGKQFMAERLQRYLTFFHGAQCEVLRKRPKTLYRLTAGQS